MDLFEKAKTIRLRSIKDKYLTAEDDEESVCQTREGSSLNAVWEVELEKNRHVVRFKSCYGKYLTATNTPFLPGAAGKKVLQTKPDKKADPSIEWVPVRDGFLVRLKSMSGDFLRPNGGLPPWRNTVTHDVPRWQKSREKLLWDVEVAEPLPLIHRRTRSDDSTFSR